MPALGHSFAVEALLPVLIEYSVRYSTQERLEFSDIAAWCRNIKRFTRASVSNGHGLTVTCLADVVDLAPLAYYVDTLHLRFHHAQCMDQTVGASVRNWTGDR